MEAPLTYKSAGDGKCTGREEQQEVLAAFDNRDNEHWGRGGGKKAFELSIPWASRASALLKTQNIGSFMQRG